MHSTYIHTVVLLSLSLPNEEGAASPLFFHMRSALRRLEAIHADTAPSSEEQRPSLAQRAESERDRERRLARLSPYKQCEFRCLECIQQLREALKECRATEASLQALTGGGQARASASAEDSERDGGEGGRRAPLNAFEANTRAVLQQQLARSRQAARRAHQQLQRLSKEAYGLGCRGGNRPADPSGAAREEADFLLLRDHIENAKRFYREEFHITVIASQDDPLLHGEGAPLLGGVDGDDEDEAAGRRAVAASRGRRLQDLFPSRSSSEQSKGRGGATGARASREDDSSAAAQEEEEALGYRNAREDAEFQQFFLEVQRNDEVMDQALDRIAAGVHRIRDNALSLQEELSVQSTLLDQTEAKVERNQEDVHRMNRRLRHAIHEVKDSSVCSYVMCLLALLFVLAILIKVAS